MEVIVSVFAALVAGSCLLAVVKSDLQAKKLLSKRLKKTIPEDPLLQSSTHSAAIEPA